MPRQGLGLAGALGTAAFSGKLEDILAERELARLKAEAVARQTAQTDTENRRAESALQLQRDQLTSIERDRAERRTRDEESAKDAAQREIANNFQLAVTAGAPGQDLTEAAEAVKGNRYAEPVVKGLRREGTPSSLPSLNLGATTAQGEIPATGIERGIGVRLINPKPSPQSTRSERTQFRDIPAPPGKTGKWQQLYDLDTGTPIGEPSPAYETPRQAGELSANQEQLAVQRFTGEWDKAVKPIVDMNRAAQLMDVGMARAREGDMVAGSQAVLVTFQKILDPESVVRESEYARSAAGLALFSRIKGAMDKLEKGGAGVPIADLESFARLADDAVNALGKGYIQEVRSRLQRKLAKFKIDEDLVLTDIPTRKTPVASSSGYDLVKQPDGTYKAVKRGG